MNKNKEQLENMEIRGLGCSQHHIWTCFPGDAGKHREGLAPREVSEPLSRWWCQWCQWCPWTSNESNLRVSFLGLAPPPPPPQNKKKEGRPVCFGGPFGVRFSVFLCIHNKCPEKGGHSRLDRGAMGCARMLVCPPPPPKKKREK